MASTVNGPTGDERPQNSGVVAHLLSSYVNTGLYFARIGTIFSCLAFLFSPFFSGVDPAGIEVWYRRALLASAATSALRLHQRLKSLNTSASSLAILEALLAEDSFHYLIYSMVFAFLPPISVCLMPVFLFAVLHVTSFTQVLLNVSAAPVNAATGDGPNVTVNAAQPSYVRNLLQTAVTKINANDQPILRLIALNEIMLMVVCIFMALSGPRIIILPFLYYPFLKMRYNSRRNPHSRIAFQELRTSLTALARHPKCPGFASRMIDGLIGVVCRLGASRR
ncbi:Transmembrane protein 33 [Fasciolopsis buskii]|uniref:Transmembrane protein 33 n=1 Tax=Fasciolopsis buskii TaxID=27845 RepID=A0A8E0VHL0_9TREM|nr:Transmembrane protein 33 [Fasciolopsis buski]